jgi:hypothetical protein
MGYEDEMKVLRDEDAEVRRLFRGRVREVFEQYYPKLTDDEIRNTLVNHGMHGDLDVRTIQAYYRTTSYIKTANALKCPGQGRVRTCVNRALGKLTEDSPLHIALTMALHQPNIRGDDA